MQGGTSATGVAAGLNGSDEYLGDLQFPLGSLTTDDANQLTPEAIARAATDRERQVIGLHRPFFYDG